MTKLFPSPTRENGTVDGQEAVLKRLLEVLVFKCLLLRNDLVQVLAGVDGHLVASVSVVNAEEGYAHVRGGGLKLLVALERLQVEHAGVRVLHAYPPALHGADAERDAVILALVRVLRVRHVVSFLCEGVARWADSQPAAILEGLSCCCARGADAAADGPLLGREDIPFQSLAPTAFDP